MATWTDETRAAAVEKYLKLKPTPTTTAECIKAVADEMGQSANGVRMILAKAGAYVPQEKAKATAATGAKPTGLPKVTKAQSTADLVGALTDLGQEADMEILEKLTAKASIYFTDILRKVEQSIDTEE